MRRGYENKARLGTRSQYSTKRSARRVKTPADSPAQKTEKKHADPAR